MDLQRERPPSYAHDETLNLPSVPTHDLPPPPTNSSALHLPALQSLGLPESQSTFSHPQPQSLAEIRGAKWHNGTLPVSAFPSVPSGALRASVEQPLLSPSTEVGSEEHGNRAQSVMSMDDPDTRAAAEALSGLRNPGMCCHNSSFYAKALWRQSYTYIPRSFYFSSMHMSCTFNRHVLELLIHCRRVVRNEADS